MNSERNRRLRQWGAGTLLGVASFATVMIATLHHISIIGFNKAFGPLSAGPTLVAYALFAIVGLVTVLSIPATLLVGVVLLFTSARRSQFISFCAALTCLLSSADVLFWFLYCGGLPGTSQRPFP